MRKSIWTMSAVALVALLAGSCAVKSDLDALTARVETVESRVDDLEAIVNNLNNTVVPGLQTLVNALDKKLTVTSVVAAEDGKSYTINFSDGTTAVISSIKGDPGVSPDAPVIGTKAEGGVLYWTVNGEFLKDAQGNKIPVTGPQGPAGNDGNDGDDGEDGHTPVLGVKADTDGILYWTVDGEFLKDANGNKVPATGSKGEPGSDGKTVGTTEIGGVLYWTVDGEVLKDGEGNPIPVRGQDGVNGTTPTVTIELVNGVWVWVINGEVAKDENGDPIPVTGAKGEDGSDGTNGITPQFKIMDGAWYVSYDNGATFERVGLVADTGTTVFVDADSDPDNVILTINTHEVLIPKEKAFALKIKYDGDLSSVGITPGESLYIEYEVVGTSTGDKVDVDVLSTTAGISARIYKVDALNGYVVIDAESQTVSGKVFVYADNNKGKTNIKSITLEEGEISAVADVTQVSPVGGEIELSVTTNIEYDAVVSDEGSGWITVAPDTRAARTDKLLIIVEPNTTASYRAATVTVIKRATAEPIEVFDIVQQPAADVVTNLNSVIALKDGEAAVANKVVVIAASDKGVIVIDESQVAVYVAIENSGAVRGDEVTIAGVKKTNADTDLPFIEATSVAVTDSNVDFDDLDWVYIGFAENQNVSNTGASGIMQKDADGNFFVWTPYLPTIFIDAPGSVDLAGLEGKVVTVEGYVYGVVSDYDAEYNFIGTLDLLALSVKEVTLEENPNWTLAFEGEVSSGGKDYDEISNTVTAGTDYYALYGTSVYKASDVTDVEEVAKFAGISASDEVTFYFSYYGETIDDNATVDSGSIYPASLGKEGDFVYIAIGLDEKGYFSGKYAYVQYTKESPYASASYDDFLGDWTFTNSAGAREYWKFVEKESGKSYYVLGLAGVQVPQGGIPAEAVFDPATSSVSISNQTLEQFEFDNQGTPINLEDQFVAVWYNSSGQPNSNEQYMSNPLIFSIAFDKDTNDPLFIPGPIDDYGYELEGFAYLAVAVDGSGVLRYNTGTSLPGAAIQKGIVEPEPDDPIIPAAYGDFLGKWVVPAANSNTIWNITPGVDGSSYAITGVGGRELTYNGEPLVVEGLYDSATGTMTIAIQRLSSDYVYDTETNATGYDLLSCIYNSGYLSTAIGTVVTTASISEGKLKLDPAVVNNYKVESLTMFSNRGGWYLLGAQTPLPTVAEPAPDEDEGYAKWLGTWTLTDSTDPALTYDITIAQNTPNESYIITGMQNLNYDFLKVFAAYDASTKELVLMGGNDASLRVGTNINIGVEGHSFDFYLEGLRINSAGTAQSRVNGNYELGRLSLNADGTTNFVPGSVRFSGEEEGKPFEGQRYYAFAMDDASIVYSFGTITNYPIALAAKSAGAPAITSFAAPNFEGMVKAPAGAAQKGFEPLGRKLNVKNGMEVQKMSSAKKVAKVSAKKTAVPVKEGKAVKAAPKFRDAKLTK